MDASPLGGGWMTDIPSLFAPVQNFAGWASPPSMPSSCSSGSAAEWPASSQHPASPETTVRLASAPQGAAVMKRASFCHRPLSFVGSHARTSELITGV